MMPFCDALPEWKRLAIAPNCAAIRPAACEPARPSALTYWSVLRLSILAIAAADAEGSGQAAGVEAAVEGAGADGVADAGAEFEAGDDCKDDVLAVDTLPKRFRAGRCTAGMTPAP